MHVYEGGGKDPFDKTTTGTGKGNSEQSSWGCHVEILGLVDKEMGKCEGRMNCTEAILAAILPLLTHLLPS